MNDKTFIVCIELNTLALREKFELGGFGNYSPIVKVMDNVYLLRAGYNCTSSMLRDSIISYLGTQDINIFVMKSSIDASWRLSSSLDITLKNII